MLEIPLINKYRPDSFDDPRLIGHTEVLGALQRSLKSDSRAHSFLLTGPSGLGKTTIARIIANEIKAEVNEIDAATNNGVDTMRALVEMSQYSSLSGSGVRMFIIDECHMLSKSSWNAILKMLEEPPSHLYIALCTTEIGKVIETVRTRCYHIALRPLSHGDIQDLVIGVSGAEGWEVANDVVSAVIQAATGQPRKALSILQAVHDAPSREEVKRIITLMDDSEPVLTILRAYVAGKTLPWGQVQPLLKKLEGEDFEQIIEMATGYLTAVVVNSENEQTANNACELLEIFTKPLATFNPKARFIVAIGRVLAR